MTSLNVRVIRQQVGVPSINNARIITQPAANLVQTYPGTDKQGSESAPHGMRRYPRQADRAYVFVERSGEIVAVSVPAMLHGGLQHKWLVQSVAFQKDPEYICQWDGPFLPVLKIHGGGFA